MDGERIETERGMEGVSVCVCVFGKLKKRERGRLCSLAIGPNRLGLHNSGDACPIVESNGTTLRFLLSKKSLRISYPNFYMHVYYC